MDTPEHPKPALPHTEMEVPDWNDLRLLNAVLRAGSLTRAARMVGQSQATASRQMDRLERIVGVKLLERSTSGAQLTRDGLALVEDLRSAWDILERAMARMHAPGRTRETAKLVTTDGVATYWIPRFLPFLKDSSIELRLFTAHEAGQDRHEHFDMSIHFMPPNDPNAVFVKLGMFHFLPYASADYLARHGTPRKAEDLAHHSLLDHAFYLIDKGTWKMRLPETGDDVRVSLFTNSSTVLVESARNGAGICWLPSYVSVFERNLVPLDLGLNLSTPIYLCHYRDSENNSAVRAVIHFLKHIFDRRKMPWLRDAFVPPSQFPPQTVESIMASYAPLQGG
ncbi:MAG TPA: LysR family transcriptional regulator [Rhizomicrobium sp.]|nr:LysR family transcriptional regulator [Rhizomicrobium sp.]